MKFNKTKAITAVLLVSVLLLAFAPVANAAATDQYSDLSGHWASAVIEKWINNGIVTIRGDVFYPDREISRAEFFLYLTRLFNVTDEADISMFNDVPYDSEYYPVIRRAVAMGATVGNGDGTMTPNAPITREQIATIIGRVLSLKASEPGNVSSFYDAWDISPWATEFISAALTSGYMQGTGGGEFTPKGNIRRGHAIQLLDNIASSYCTEQREYSGINNKNVVINRAGVTLSNSTISGDLIIADGVGEGNVTISKTTVNGRIIVRGGGSGSIYLNGVTANGGVYIDKPNNSNVNIAADRDSAIDNIVVYSSNATISTKKSTKNVYLTQPNSNVTIAGTVSNLHIDQEGINVNVTGTLSNLNLTNATGAQVSVSGSVTTLTTGATGCSVNVTSSGRVSRVVNNTENINFTNSGTITNFDTKTSVTLSGNDPQAFTIPNGVTATLGSKQVMGTTSGFIVTNDDTSLNLSSVTVNGESAAIAGTNIAITLSRQATRTDNVVEIKAIPVATQNVSVSIAGANAYANTSGTVSLSNLNWTTDKANVEITVTSLLNNTRTAKYTLSITRTQPLADLGLSSINVGGASVVNANVTQSSASLYQINLSLPTLESSYDYSYSYGYNSINVTAVSADPTNVAMTANGIALSSGVTTTTSVTWSNSSTANTSGYYTRTGVLSIMVADRNVSTNTREYRITMTQAYRALNTADLSEVIKEAQRLERLGKSYFTNMTDTVWNSFISVLRDAEVRQALQQNGTYGSETNLTIERINQIKEAGRSPLVSQINTIYTYYNSGYYGNLSTLLNIAQSHYNSYYNSMSESVRTTLYNALTNASYAINNYSSGSSNYTSAYNTLYNAYVAAGGAW